MKFTSKPIDAASELEKAARGKSELGEQRRGMPKGARLFIMFVMLIALAIMLGVIYRAYVRLAPEEKAPTAKIANHLPEIKREEIKPETPQMPENRGTVIGFDFELPDLSITPPSAAHLRRLNSTLQGEPSPGDQAETSTSVSATANDQGPLANHLQPMRLSKSTAAQIGDMNFLVRRGATIDCLLITRIITGQPGMLKCLAPNDVMSANGKVKLIDAGTVFSGYQEGGMQQGQQRIFATWSSLDTPLGVTVNLDSPGTGPLGEAGLGGHIDHHFGERFGNAILLSIIGDLSAMATSRNSNEGTIRFDNTREGTTDVASKVLEHSLDIPPTLYKNQGERISIMVARDLDFSDVYELKPAN